MQACSTLNVAASLLIVAIAAHAGCSGNAPKPSAPTPATTGPAAADPKVEPTAEPGDGTNAPAGDETAPGADGGEVETRTTEVIQKLVQDNRKPVRECYEKARKQIPDLKGTMTIRFVLDPEGKVKEAVLNVERSEVKSPDVVKCSVEVIKKIKFPASSRGMESTINYPFTFNP